MKMAGDWHDGIWYSNEYSLPDRFQTWQNRWAGYDKEDYSTYRLPKRYEGVSYVMGQNGRLIEVARPVSDETPAYDKWLENHYGKEAGYYDKGHEPLMSDAEISEDSYVGERAALQAIGGDFADDATRAEDTNRFKQYLKRLYVAGGHV
jgi:hypothetical protein